MMKWFEERRELRRMIEARLTQTRHVLSDTQYAEEEANTLLDACGHGMTRIEVLRVQFRLTSLLIKRLLIASDYDMARWIPWTRFLMLRSQLTDFYGAVDQLAADAIRLSEDFTKFFAALRCLDAVNNLSADGSIKVRVREVSTLVAELHPYDESAVDGILQACSDLSGRQQFGMCIDTDAVARFRFENEELLNAITDDVELLCLRLL